MQKRIAIVNKLLLLLFDTVYTQRHHTKRLIHDYSTISLM